MAGGEKGLKATMNQISISKAEWDALRYPVELQQLSHEEGGGWMAWIPLLGKGMFMVNADTAAEAIDRLEALRKDAYEMVTRSGQPIPMPEDVADVPMASGKWLQRASRRLHAEMRAAAAKDGVSFNTYCQNAMQRGHMMRTAESAFRKLAEGICDDFHTRVAGDARTIRAASGGLTP